MFLTKLVITPSSKTTGFRNGAPNPGGARYMNGALGAVPPNAAAAWDVRTVPHSKQNDPLVVIALAETSPIAIADIYLGGRDGFADRFRIAPGCPFIGDLRDDQIAICPVKSFPVFSFGGACDHFYWNANGSVVNQDDTAHWPSLELNVWRDLGSRPVPSINYQRAPLIAEVTGHSNTNRDVALIVCTDERQNVDMEMFVNNNLNGCTGVNYFVYGIDGVMDVSQNASAPSGAAFPINNGSGPGGGILESGAIPVSGLATFEYQGRGYQYIAIRLAPVPAATGDFSFCMRVTATDS